MVNSISLQRYRVLIVYFPDMKIMPFHKYVLMKEKRNRPLCMSPEKQVARYCLLNYIKLYISIL